MDVFYVLQHTFNCFNLTLSLLNNFKITSEVLSIMSVTICFYQSIMLHDNDAFYAHRISCQINGIYASKICSLLKTRESDAERRRGAGLLRLKNM